MRAMPGKATFNPVVSMDRKVGRGVLTAPQVMPDVGESDSGALRTARPTIVFARSLNHTVAWPEPPHADL